MNAEQVVETLRLIGTLLELKGENPFKSRAYHNAARALESLEVPLEQLVAEGRLDTVKGVGEGLRDKITALVTTGQLPYLEELRASVPAGLLVLLTLPGLGPKKVKALHDQLGVNSVETLEAACRDGRVAALEGFGEKTQGNILEGMKRQQQYATRHLLSEAAALAEPLLESLRAHPDVVRCGAAGSLRRSRETIGDVDLLASSKNPVAVIEDFVQQPGIQTVLAQGETKASVVLGGGLQVDLRVVADSEYASALAYFTGSKEHNIVMRQRAIQRGLRLNEYGLFRSEVETRDPALRVPCATEEAIYAALDLEFVPPELREDHGEFEAAEARRLPRLLEWTELRGSLHNHSNWSDGWNSLEQIAGHMHGLGCDYWAVTDHSKSSFQANGLDESRLRQQGEAIRQLNATLAARGIDFRLLRGIEVDILSGGRLDFDDDLLAGLEVVVASLHQASSKDGAENTRRIVQAVANRQVHILAHPTGRLLLEREAYPVDTTAVIEACAATGTWLEINAHPSRFDLDWRLWKHAKSRGVRCVINCDAHRNEQAGYLRLGAGVARKGWLTRQDVINTLPLAELRQELARKRNG